MITKQRVTTLLITIALLYSAIMLYQYGTQHPGKYNPYTATEMLVLAAIDTFFGCVLQTFNRYKIAQALASIIFFLLCAGLLYAITFIDYVVFAISMLLVIRKSINICDCMNECDNIFR